MSDVLHQRAGRIGYLTLNRAQTLNSLVLPMIEALHAGLDAHLADPAVEAIVIRSASDRAFCAGGDMKRIRELSLAGSLDEASLFFEREYALNLRIAQSPKPWIALIDGVAMGGGMGLSVHGRYRVVTERTVMAMPEAAIGFFPDVGGSYFLPRLPANAGWWMGLTGARVHGAHAVQLGLATHLVNRDRIPALANALESSEAGSIEAVLSLHAHEAHDAAFGFQVAARERWFEPDSLAAIETRLQADDTDDARSLLDAMRAGSPHSRRVMFDLMQQGATLPLSEALRIEHRTAREIIEHPDFIEGVRAVLVDKDRDARWVAP